MAENKLTGAARFLLKYLLFSAAAGYIAAYIVVAFFRLSYPFDLEWLEGNSVVHVVRILSGQSIYVKPSLEYIPYNYTPLFFYVSAVAAFIFKAGFQPLRLVSVLSSIGCFYLIYLFVKRETESRFCGFLASGLFAATFHLSGSWFDTGRPDSLFLFLLIWSFYLIRFRSSAAASFFAGLAMSAAFFTKQTALPILLPVSLYLLFAGRRRLLYFIITCAAIIGGGTLIFDYFSSGWFSYYVFELPSNFSSRVEPFRWRTFWTEDIISPFKIVLGMSFCYFLLICSKPKKDKFLFYLLTTAGMFAASLAPRLQAGGIENVLIPAYAMLSILFGLSFHAFCGFAGEMQPLKRNILLILVYSLSLLQFGSGYIRYDPFPEVPSNNDLESGRKLLKIIAGIEGDVFLPSRSYLPELAGKKSAAPQQLIKDNLVWGKDEVRAGLAEELNNAFKDRRFGAVILDSGREEWMTEEAESSLEQNYILKENIIYPSDVAFLPIAGLRTRPERVYVPIK